MTSPETGASAAARERPAAEPRDEARDATAVDERPRRMDCLLRPRSVAVVGASANPSFVTSILKNLLRYGYAGPVVAVNPRYDRVLDAPCYPTILDVPHPLDLVVAGVPVRAIPSLLEQCEQKGIGALEIISSGFAEVGEEGARRQAELAAWARRTGIPVGGPNCLGLLHVPSGMIALPSVFERLIAGSVAVVLQSGLVAPSVLAPLFARGIGLTFGVTAGNEADLEAADYIRYFAADDETRVIGCFGEQIKTPARFVEACELAAERQKPIVMLKIGRSEASRRVAAAHTGSLVGTDGVVDAALRKLGVTRVASLDELLEALAVFHARKLPRAGGVAPVSVSGGAAGLLCDLAAECGVSYPPLPDETARELRAVVPEYGSVGNPLDVTGQGVFDTELLGRSLDLLAAVPDVGVVVYGRGFPARIDRQSPVGRVLEQAVAKHPDVLFLVLALVGGHYHQSQSPDVPVVDPTDHLDGVPFLQGAVSGLKAIGALIRYAAFQRERGAARRGRLVSEAIGERARALVRAARAAGLTEREGKAILALYGIRTTRETLATGPAEALAAAERIGYPVALKVESPDLLHKTEAGALLLDVRDAAALAAGFERVVANARRYAPDADVRGVLVQEMVGPGTELIVGMSQEPGFGPVVACGLGGIFVEALQDVELLLPPLSEGEARAALARLRGYPLLRGARGARPADVDAVVEALLRFSELCHDLRDVAREIDVNPLVAFEAGRGVCAVDCLIVPESRDT
jgi:acetate---CoA ligase (ADP-forming)